MKRIFYSASIYLLFGCQSCVPLHEDENHHYNIYFHNNSDSDVYIRDDWEYPDTSVLYDGVYLSPHIYKTTAHSKNDMAFFHREAYESFFRSINDTMVIYVFDAKKIETEGSHVRDAVIYRYVLSYDDLKRRNWAILYPEN